MTFRGFKPLASLMIAVLLLNACASRPEYRYDPTIYGSSTQYQPAEEEGLETEWRINWEVLGPILAVAGIVISVALIAEAGRNAPEKLTSDDGVF